MDLGTIRLHIDLSLNGCRVTIYEKEKIIGTTGGKGMDEVLDQVIKQYPTALQLLFAHGYIFPE